MQIEAGRVESISQPSPGPCVLAIGGHSGSAHPLLPRAAPHPKLCRAQTSRSSGAGSARDTHTFPLEIALGSWEVHPETRRDPTVLSPQSFCRKPTENASRVLCHSSCLWELCSLCLHPQLLQKQHCWGGSVLPGLWGEAPTSASRAQREQWGFWHCPCSPAQLPRSALMHLCVSGVGFLIQRGESKQRPV